jgi:hypothetical protein
VITLNAVLTVAICISQMKVHALAGMDVMQEMGFCAVNE